ncbi:cupin domain-containing protein [Desulfonema magnum]|uniref:Cupin domain-containing protein n=1 Tax=Desulfonema magnum TaxID=45655 RepID=A0A975BGG1_9BACT|nr:cupin domain-containing protein [Desulfonema magnum]QTA84610.1 Cupin domain-containing protein [Desulfonema magnum]
MDTKNIFSEIPKHIPDEVFEEIIKTGHCKIERIISKGHSSPADDWYDQENNEWVIVLRGRAGLVFEGKDEVLVMKPGNYINIPARQKHRVAWTDSDEETIWLAIHY